MSKLVSIGKALLYPHAAVLVFVSVISFGGMIISSLLLGGSHIITYLSYGASAYSLTIICVRIPRIVKFYKHLRMENPFVVRWFSDERLRVHVSLISSLIMCAAYTALNLGLAIWHSSVWYYSLFAYYALLVFMRVFLLRDMGAVGAENGFLKELKRYRFVAITLIPMNLALSGITLYIVGFGYGMRHHYITTIALAAYTFFSLTMSIIAAVKYRRYNSPLYSATKAVGLVSSAVSMLTLETAMLAAFGSAGEEQFRRIITALTGAAVFIFTLAVSIYMLSRASKEFKRIKTESNG